MIWRLLGVVVAGLGLGSLCLGTIALIRGEVTFTTNRAGFIAFYADNPLIFLGSVLFYLLGGIVLVWLGQKLIRDRASGA